MKRYPIIAGLFLLCASARAQINLAPDPHANDPIYQELKRLTSDQANCFKKEAQSKKLNKVDLETAAFAVLVNCSPQTQRYKGYMANHFPGNPPQFEQWWNQKEQDAMQFAKNVFALVRTQ
jgi:hypothetical protein